MFSAVLVRRRWPLAAIAVTGALAATAGGALDSHNPEHSALIAAQRAKIAQLAIQRDEALAAAQQAQSRQAASRAQAIRWRTRALAKRRVQRRRSRRGARVAKRRHNR
jgi:hypothetical protein